MNTRVLIVGSEEMQQEVLQSKLEKEGYLIERVNQLDEIHSYLAQEENPVTWLFLEWSEQSDLKSLEEVVHSYPKVKIVFYKPSNSKSLATDQATNGERSSKSNVLHLQLVSSQEISYQATSYMEAKRKWSDSFERNYLTDLLNRHKGNVSHAAREAKMDRSNFLRLLRRHSIRSVDHRKAA
jgi:DNA-binding NtrC family response regulator